jgi:hypothetical protein
LNSTKATSPTTAAPTWTSQNCGIGIVEYQPPTSPTTLLAMKKAR